MGLRDVVADDVANARQLIWSGRGKRSCHIGDGRPSDGGVVRSEGGRFNHSNEGLESVRMGGWERQREREGSEQTRRDKRREQVHKMSECRAVSTRHAGLGHGTEQSRQEKRMRRSCMEDAWDPLRPRQLTPDPLPLSRSPGGAEVFHGAPRLRFLGFVLSRHFLPRPLSPRACRCNSSLSACGVAFSPQRAFPAKYSPNRRMT